MPDNTNTTIPDMSVATTAATKTFFLKTFSKLSLFHPLMLEKKQYMKVSVELGKGVILFQNIGNTLIIAASNKLKVIYTFKFILQ